MVERAPRAAHDGSGLQPRAWQTSPRAERARAWLDEAEAGLAEAREALAESPSRYLDALPHVLAVFRDALMAFLAWEAEMPVDEDAGLDDLAGRAVRMSSVLKTAVHRALRLAARAPAIERADRLSVHDREDVETGWYTARNLLRAVQTELPPALLQAPQVSTPTPSDHD